MTPDLVLDSRYSWIRVGLALLIAVAGNVGMWVVTVVLPELQAEFGLSRSLSSLTYAATMVGSPPATSALAGCRTGWASPRR